MVPKIKFINSEKIDQALIDNTRQYLVGILGRTQNLNHIEDNKLEIGMTRYDEFYSEKPHVHQKAYEYQYMISGYTKYLNLDTREEFTFRKGDFYLIEPGVKYAQKSKPGTQILFIKTPPGNDKIDLPMNNDVKQWVNAKIRTVRKDYSNDTTAPIANSLKPAAAVAVIEEDKILLLKRGDSGNWTMPGGTMEFGESIIGCAIRELKEETGLDIDILDMIGTYTDPNTVVEYSDGEVRQEFSLVYYGKLVGGNLQIDDESTDYKWVNLNEVFNYRLADSQKKRLLDVIEYLNSEKRSFK